MSKELWKKLENRIDDHSYMSGVVRDADRVKSTGEIFTPTSLVIEMIQKTPKSSFSPGKRILDPSCGDGQFLVGAKWFKVLFLKMREKDALLDIFGVDIMRDNVTICKARLGGGTILMGDALDPYKKIKGQTTSEHKMMIEIFGSQEIMFFED